MIAVKNILNKDTLPLTNNIFCHYRPLEVWSTFHQYERINIKIFHKIGKGGGRRGHQIMDLEMLDFDNYAPCQDITENILHDSVEVQPFELQTLLLMIYFYFCTWGGYYQPHYTLPHFLLQGRSLMKRQSSYFCHLFYFTSWLTPPSFSCRYSSILTWVIGHVVQFDVIRNHKH